MANEEQLRILRQGVKAWNRWREENQRVRPDLNEVDLSEADLSEALLSEADLRGANLSEANLSEADLSEADLRGADLRGANLHDADLSEAQLWRANLEGAGLNWANLCRGNLSETNLTKTQFGGADLSQADLSQADLSEAVLYGATLDGANLRAADLYATDARRAKLSDANLSDTNLRDANLSHTDLSEADLGNARFAGTVLGNTNLSEAKRIETCTHAGPSIIDHHTLQRSGTLPLSFLRGCGLPDEFIEYIPSILGQGIEFYSCFISYSSRDQEFVERIHSDLQDKGVRCWFATEDMKIGDRIRDTIEDAIRLRDKVLVILSETSVASEWVEDEVEKAMEEERKSGKTVLFPVLIDDAVLDTDKAWAAKLRRQRHIGDFRNWKDHDAYSNAFERLLRNLKKQPQ